MKADGRFVDTAAAGTTDARGSPSAAVSCPACPRRVPACCRVGGRAGFDQIAGFLKTQATVALTRQTSEEESRAIVEAAIADVDRLRRFDGTFDQTFVRLEILARRPVS